MISFDHRRPGTAAEDWLLPELPAAPVPRPTDRVLVLAAHPDDETLGAGGLIAACARIGAHVEVVVATDGEASHPDSPTTTRDDLARRRRTEVRAAVGRLTGSGAKPELLGLPDGALAAHERWLTDRVAARLDDLDATQVISPWSGDGHPDHETCGRVAARLAAGRGIAHWQYPIWAWHWADAADGPFAPLSRLPLTAADHVAKSAALACHTSQHSPLSPAVGDEVLLPPAVLEHFARESEYYVITPGSPAADATYFDRLYAERDDPWELAKRFYEQRKRALIMATLPRARFRRAFEPGCATGLLTEQLCARVDDVLASDSSERAVEQARRRAPRAHIEHGRIPSDWPTGEFDLIVLSEVGYYCVDLDELATRARSALREDGVLVACHWRHPAPDHPHTAQAVHDALGRSLPVLVQHVEADFLLHVWSRDGRSVAQHEGIVA